MKSSTSAATRFDRTTAVRRISDEPLRYAVDLDESWASLRGVHGGYCTALLVRAAEATFPDRAVRTVAVCGGAGDFLLDDVRRSDADVYVTSDLRHHPASEFLEHGGPALVDVAHWAAEWTWLPVVAEKVRQALGDTVDSRVSTICTDPWTARVVGEER